MAGKSEHPEFIIDLITTGYRNKKLGLRGVLFGYRNPWYDIWMNSFPLHVDPCLFPVSLLHQSIDIHGFDGLIIMSH